MFLFRRSRKTSQTPPDSLDQPSAPPDMPATQPVEPHARGGSTSLHARDMQEANRLDFQHFLLRQLLKGHYVAPVSSPRNILDVGCGTGRWLLDVGQEFPLARLVGFDIEIPVFTERLDPLYQFVQGDLLQGLPFPDNSFDFVHQRFLITMLPATSWPTLLKRLIQVTLPGGWLELVEVTHLMTPSGACGQQVQQWTEQICGSSGIDPYLPQHLGSMLKASPLLDDVHFMYIDAPIGDWGGRLGTLMAKNYLSAYEHSKSLYQQALHIDPQIFDQTLDGMRQEWEVLRSTSRIYMVYGRRR